MIYISSSCITKAKIKDSVEELAINGFKNIELSGGTNYYKGFENDLLELKEKYTLSYRCHNYFPPPIEHFVVNLASLDKEIYNKSIEHIKKAISLSKILGSSKYGFHAGFLININKNEIGRKISKSNLNDRKEAVNQFYSAFEIIKKSAEGVELYIENNVLSKTNFETFNGENAFMLTNFSDYKSIKENIDFNLLFDVAHLKVSVKTLGLNWENEFMNMMKSSDYIHISDNDGFHDLNNQLKKTSNMFSMIKNNDTSNKTFTLEIYEGLDAIKMSYEALSEAVT